MNTNEIIITQQSHLDPKQTEQFRAIYVSSFPAPERGDFDELMGEIGRGTRLFFTALAGKDLIGFAVTLRLKPTNIHVLEYLAVEQASRNRGIGARLLRHAGETLKASSRASAIILEVEPDDEGAPDERQLRARRIGFYRRLGAKTVDCAPRYRAPNLAGPGTVNFRLLWIALSNSADVPTGAQLRDTLLNLYTQSYDLAPDDPLVVASIQDLVC